MYLTGHISYYTWLNGLHAYQISDNSVHLSITIIIFLEGLSFWGSFSNLFANISNIKMRFWPIMHPWIDPWLDPQDQTDHQHIRRLAIKVCLWESQDENLECSANYYIIKIVRSSRQWRYAYWQRIIPVIVNQIQNLAYDIIVKPSPTFVMNREQRIWLWDIFHEPMDHQDFESVSILIVPTIYFFSELNLYE